jgi:P-type E1-E2 ATPase
VGAASTTGLTSAEAATRLAAAGPRDGPDGSRSARSIVRANVLTLVNGITLAFLVLIAAAGAWNDAIFAGVIAVNTVIGITQELLAKRKLDHLALLIAPRARVRRDGVEQEIAPEGLVVDDVVELGPGDQVVADGVVLAASSLAIDESILTGESDAIGKAPGEQVLSGAYCTAGSGLYRVTAVGGDAFASRLTAEAREAGRRLSTLQLEINRLLRALVLLMLPLAAILVFALSVHHTAFREAAQTATAGLISIVPEGLVLLASITFAAGAVRIARFGALAQQLNAIESLASVDTVCIDKTGTLTDGTLELAEVIPAAGVEDAAARHLLARIAAAGHVRSATSDAIAAALGGGPEEIVSEIPFSSRWKWSGARFADGTTLVLGAPEVLGAGALAADAEDRQRRRGRVLVFGRVEGLPPAPEAGADVPLPERFMVCGLAVLQERIRPDAVETLAFLAREGIDVKVVSGDAPATVAAVAEAVGLAGGTAIAGPDLPSDPTALEGAALAHGVFARTTPEQKRELVAALIRRGRYVAVIGDGVNDVPAMKAARIAVALGSGSQIARGVADIVLVTDDFGAIPRGIVEGRRILANVRRVAKLFVVKSAFAATLILTVGVSGAAYPLLPRHLSLAATFTVGLPAFALALASSSGRPKELSFLRDLARFSVPAGCASALAVLAGYAATRALPGRTVADARTVAVIILVLTGLYCVLLLEDDAMARSRVRRGSVLALMGALIAGLALAFALAPVRHFFALAQVGAVEVLLAVLAATFTVGVLGLFGFRAPLLARRLFG